MSQTYDDNPILLFQELAMLGPVAQVNHSIDLAKFKEEVSRHELDWKVYNPRKPELSRFGLSLTSLDGGTSGVPDLDSVREYNLSKGLNLREKDFNKRTPLLEQFQSLHGLFDFYKNDLGRCHLIKLKKGGHFPPHRDAIGELIDSFRLIAFLEGTSSNDYAFLLDDKKIYFEAGKVYFVNTTLAHSVFSFSDNVTFLVMNIILNRSCVNKTLMQLTVK